VAGLPPGRYRFLNTDVELLPGGKVIRADGGSLACASVGLDRGIMVYGQQTGSSLAEALATVTTNPARLLTRLQFSGELRTSEPANLVTFRTEAHALQVERVITGGEVAGSRSSG
jgi:N-acetylglucosamine-6-phosphate deacetylase